MKYVLSFFIAISFCSSLVGQTSKVLETWTVEMYKVELIEYSPVIEYPGILPLEIGIVQRNGRKYRNYSILKNGKELPLLQSIEVAKDSCMLSFLEYAKDRPKNGLVGTKVELNLCLKKIRTIDVNKPVIQVLNASIQPLDSTFHNPYGVQNPITVKSYDKGESKMLHSKNCESISVIFESAYLVGEFHEKDFTGNTKLHFELLFTQKGVKKKLLLYWDYFIYDGFIYDANMGQSQLFDMQLWEANLKLNGE